MEEPRIVIDPERPWEWDLRDVLGLLSDRQRRYVEALPETFRIKRADGSVVDYKPEPYQVWYHAHSPLAIGRDAPNRLIEKGRGVGATLMTAMDFLLLAHSLNRVNIPVAGRQGSTGDEFIEKCHELIDDVVIEGFFDRREDITSRLDLGNGSSIIPVPGGSPHALRSKRSPAACFDEFAFHPYPRQIWRAGRGILSEGGQLNILSTHDGAGTYYYNLVEDQKAGKIDFVLFRMPVHDVEEWDRGRSIREQVQSGQLRLISPWIDIKSLDDFYREDPPGYEQEYLCVIMDEALNLIPRKVVQAATPNPPIESWEHEVTSGEVAAAYRVSQGFGEMVAKVQELGAKIPRRPAGNINPFYLAVDFASTGDFSGMIGYEVCEDGVARQRWLLPVRGWDTSLQYALIALAVNASRPGAIGIDMTGGGTGLYELCDRHLPIQVHGIHFSGKVALKDAPNKAPIKKALAITLARLVREKNIEFLPKTHPHGALQERHLIAVRRADLDAPRSKEEGHADLFWANAIGAWMVLSLLPQESSSIDMTGYW